MRLDLTPRQIEVAILAGSATGYMSPKAIAAELDISVRTVEAHMADAAERICLAYPHICRGSPRRICQAWVRHAYHTVAGRIAA